MSKLTLSIDRETVETAKHYAARHHTSISRLVERFLADLEKDGEETFFARLHQQLEQQGYRPPSADEDELRRRHLERKYR